MSKEKKSAGYGEKGIHGKRLSDENNSKGIDKVEVKLDFPLTDIEFEAAVKMTTSIDHSDSMVKLLDTFHACSSAIRYERRLH